MHSRKAPRVHFPKIFCAYGTSEITCRLKSQLVYRALLSKSMCNCVSIPAMVWYGARLSVAATEILYDTRPPSRNCYDKCVCFNETEQIYNLNCCYCAAAVAIAVAATVFSLMSVLQCASMCARHKSDFRYFRAANVCVHVCLCVYVSVWVNRFSF